MPEPVITRRHLVRLRQIHQSSGWPCRDLLEVDLQVSGLIEGRVDEAGRETLHLTPSGLRMLADAHATNKASRSAHEDLVMRVATFVQTEGRVAWAGLALRAKVNDQWLVAIPDLFSIRNTTAEQMLEPVVHEIKVTRADLLGDIKKLEKRAAYLSMAPQVFYVLGVDGRGRSIAEASEIPEECGVMQVTSRGLEITRPAPRHPFEGFRFDVWMALAKAPPLLKDGEPPQMAL